MICFWDVSFWHCLSKKNSFKHCLTPKNLGTQSFTTKKFCLSIIYHQEIYEISWILASYCLKSKNSVKRDNTKKYRSNLFKPNLKNLNPDFSMIHFQDSHFLLHIGRSEIPNHNLWYLLIKVSSLNDLTRRWYSPMSSLVNLSMVFI